MSTFILKFGGSTFGKEAEVLSNLPNITGIIKKHFGENHKIVVVVSAFAGETRQLRDVYQNLGMAPNTHYSDKILSIGEEKSAITLTNYLNTVEGIKAAALIGPNLPILTDNNFGNADIIDINTAKIKSLLDDGNIVVIPGFIGLTTDGYTSTLGLDGSDTTAAYVAGYLGVDECRLYKDVAGIFTANPRRVHKAKKIHKINTSDMLAFSELGARILHPRALEVAKKYNMTIRVLPNFADAEGTIISTSEQKSPIIGITYWQHEKDLITVSVVGSANKGDLLKVLKHHDIKAQPFATDFDDFTTTLLLQNPADLNNALQILHSFAGLDDKAIAARTKDANFFDPGLIQV